MSEKNSISQQLQDLDQLITWFDQPDFDLDKAIAKFEEGSKLVADIQTKLDTFENKITVLKERFDQGS
jgi:exodeoxyribonuclease VII small subunit